MRVWVLSLKRVLKMVEETLVERTWSHTYRNSDAILRTWDFIFQVMQRHRKCVRF